MRIKQLEKQNKYIISSLIIGMVIGLSQHLSLYDASMASAEMKYFMATVLMIYVTIMVASDDTIAGLFNLICVTIGLIVYNIIFSTMELRICDNGRLLAIVPVIFVVVYGFVKELQHNLTNGCTELLFGITSVLVFSISNTFLGFVSAIVLLVAQLHIMKTQET